MRQVEAKFLIVHEWACWRDKNLQPDEQGSGTDALAFYVFLQQEKPDLLDFNYQGDRWQIVHAWLLSDGLVAG